MALQSSNTSDTVAGEKIVSNLQKVKFLLIILQTWPKDILNTLSYIGLNVKDSKQ